MEAAVQTLVKVYLKSSKGKENLSKKDFQNLVKNQLGNILSDSDSKEAINNMAVGLDENQDGKLGFPEYMKLIGYLATSLSEQRGAANEEPAQNATGQVANSHPDKEEKTGANSEVKAELKADGKDGAASVGLKLDAPKVEVPSLDVKVDAPKVEVPSLDVKVDAPKVEVPSLDVKVDAPKVEVPSMDVKVDAPKVEVPKVEVPKAGLNIGGGTVEVPKVGLNMGGGTVEVPKADLNVGGGTVELPKVEVPSLDVNVEGPKVDVSKIEGDANELVNNTTTTLNDMVSGAVSGVVTEVNKVTDAFKVTEAKDAEEKTEEATS